MFRSFIKLQYVEFKYKLTNDSTDLINLCIQNIDSFNYDKKIYYLSKAVEIDDFIKISKENQLFISQNEDSTQAAENTYYCILTECMFSYIYAEKYDEFDEVFPNLYKKLCIDYQSTSYFYAWIKQTNKISKKGYQHIIKALEDNAPPLVEIVPENKDELRWYSENLSMRSVAYLYMGDEATSKKLNDECVRISEELISKMKEN